MSLIVAILIVILILALAIYGVGLLPLPYQLANIIRFVLVLVAVVYLIRLAGIA